jgi:lipopolysaccharide export LptBFGC system permease protein LptF
MTDQLHQPPGRDIPDKSDDLTRDYERAAFHLVPRIFFPFFAAFFVLLCGGMAVMLFAVGKIFGGLLFSFVVLVGLYVLYNKLMHKDPAHKDV